jgi:hypothetical protein
LPEKIHYIVFATVTGLPDGLFSNRKSQFLVKFGGLGIQNIVTFYGHLEYITAIWYNLQPFAISLWPFGIFFHFGMFGPRKIWQPCAVIGALRKRK